MTKGSDGFKWSALFPDVKPIVSIEKMAQGYKLFLGWVNESEYPPVTKPLLLKGAEHNYPNGEEVPASTILSHEVATALLTELWFVGLRPNGWSESVANNGFETVIAVLTSEKEWLSKQLAQAEAQNLQLVQMISDQSANFADAISKKPPSASPFHIVSHPMNPSVSGELITNECPIEGDPIGDEDEVDDPTDPGLDGTSEITGQTVTFKFPPAPTPKLAEDEPF